MSISEKSIECLLHSLNFYEKEYHEISQNCYSEVKSALEQILYAKYNDGVYVLPYGSYSIASNYQFLEPLEFYVVITKCNKNYSQKRETEERQANKKRKKNSFLSIKHIYNDILTDSTQQKDTIYAGDVANTIMQNMKSYLAEEDIVYYQNNMVFMKLHTADDTIVNINITIVYDYDKNDEFEFKKLGYTTKENSKLIMQNIVQKDKHTNGNYGLLCKLLKMLELELIINDLSQIYLSKKSLFMESLLYNVPNNLYNADYSFPQMITNATNYLTNCNVNNILLPDEKTKMFKSNGYYAKQHFNSIIKKLLYLNKNTDILLEEAVKLMETENNSENKTIKLKTNKKFEN